MNPLRSVGARLSLALLVVVAGVLGFVYLFVVPSLESRGEHAELQQLQRAAPSLARQLAADPYDPNFVDNAAATANARVVLYEVLTFTPPVLQVIGDSRGGVSSRGVENDPYALKTALSGDATKGTLTRGKQEFAEVAVPTGTGSVLLLIASLRDTQANVHLVQRRLLLAGGLALMLALVVGYGGSWMFARRLRRLESAAERIASGHFDEPVIDRGADEVGELARTFEVMRGRLARLDNARREFIANASHELRTPLFSLAGFLELLDEEGLDDETREDFLASMRDQVTRLTKLTSELLDLSRLDAGHLSVERVPVDLGAVVEDVVAELVPRARKSGHEVVVRGGAATASADDRRVAQIVRVLLDNALRHTPAGSRVEVGVSQERAGACIRVEDDGPGIGAADAGQVFERFYRAEDGSHASGSGLGLAIARELAELMGGTLVLESARRPTVFAVRLPAGDPAETQQAVGAAAS